MFSAFWLGETHNSSRDTSPNLGLSEILCTSSTSFFNLLSHMTTLQGSWLSPQAQCHTPRLAINIFLTLDLPYSKESHENYQSSGLSKDSLGPVWKCLLPEDYNFPGLLLRQLGLYYFVLPGTLHRQVGIESVLWEPLLRSDLSRFPCLLIRGPVCPISLILAYVVCLLGCIAG